MPTVDENIVAHLYGAIDALVQYQKPGHSRSDTIAELAGLATRIEDNLGVDPDHLRDRLKAIQDDTDIVSVRQDLRRARQYAVVYENPRKEEVSG